MADIVGPWRHGAYGKKTERWEPVGHLAELKADSQLEAHQRFVTVSADGKAARAGTNAFVVGVGFAQVEPNVETGNITNRVAGGPQPVAVQVTGVAKLELGATVTRGAQLKSTNSGRGTPATADADNVGAVALEAGNAGDVVQVLVMPGARYVA